MAALQDLIDDEDTVNMVELQVWCREDPAWASYSVPPLHVEVETVATAYCHVYTDPHLITYDQARYDLYSRGTFLLTATQDGRLEVEVRLWRCGPVSCVCGIVAREDNDVVSIDMCGGEYGDSVPVVKLFNIRQEQIETRLYEARQGKILMVQFPSGRSIQAGLEYWGISLSVRATGADHGQTRGLCGTFDGEKETDLTDGEQWRVAPGRSMFDSVPSPGRSAEAERTFSVCPQQTEIVMMEGLTTSLLPSQLRHYVDITPVLQLPDKYVNDQPAAGEPPRDSNKEVDTPDGLNIYWTPGTHRTQETGQHQHRHRRLVITEEEEEEDSLPGSLRLHYPTASGLTEDSVHSVCAGTLLNSSISRLCSRYIKDQLPLAVDICVLDVTLMDDPSWAQYSLPLVEMMCEAEVSRAQLGWDINYNGQLVAPVSLTTALNCPNNCSSHGDCSGLRCVCHTGYSSYDCSHVDGGSHLTSETFSYEKIFQTSVLS